MKKIIITGALGYIGMELCKIYSGKSLHYDVLAIDNKFYSTSVLGRCVPSPPRVATSHY